MQHDLTRGPITRTMLLFAGPMIAGNLLQQFYNIADTLIVGQFLGAQALAAVGSAFTLMTFLTSILLGLCMGSGAVFSIRYGERNEEKLKSSIFVSFVMIALVTLVMNLLVFLLIDPIIRFMNIPSDVYGMMRDYLWVIFAGIGFVFLYNYFAALLRAVGNSLAPLLFLAVSAVTNIVLDLLFVAVFHWGVASAALATIISQILSAALAFRKLMSVDTMYKVTLRKVRFDLPMLKQIVTLGIPSGVQNSVISLANVIVQANINAFGADAMAGCGTYYKLEGFAFLPVTCFALALSTFISQNIGAEKYDRVKAGMKFGLICSPVLAECIGILFYIFAPYLIGAFNSNPDVIAFGVQQARTLSLFYCLLSYSHCCAGILRGFGRPIIPMIIMLADWCLFRITYITIAVRIIPNIQVVFWAYPITWTISTILFTLYLRKIRFPVTSEKERNFAN